MRILSLPVDEDLLEVHVCWWSGKEKVYWNGTEVSSKWHFIGSKHHFTVDAPDGSGIDNIRVTTSYGWLGYQYDVFYNAKCLLASGRTKVSRVQSNWEGGGSAKPVHVPRRKQEELSLEELEEQLV